MMMMITVADAAVTAAVCVLLPLAVHVGLADAGDGMVVMRDVRVVEVMMMAQLMVQLAAAAASCRWYRR